MGNSFLRNLIATAKSKVTPLVTKLRYFLSPQFWKTQVLTKFRQAFSKIFNVRPKDKDDYYGVGRYLVSKRLAYALVLTIGVFSAVYIIAMRGALLPKTDSIKEYKYNSVMLRFAKSDDVIIKGKGGYKAYEGAVKSGAVTGVGSLYNKKGTMVYHGSFENNKYSGTGTSYFESGNIAYQGEFANNLYEGVGKLYRDTGVIEYTGDFSQGMKNGTGTYYNPGGQPVYTGEFSQDELVYSVLLDKTASEARESYTGSWIAYQSGDDYCVNLTDIDAVYSGTSADESVADEIVVNTVYVLKNKFKFGKDTATSIEEVKKILGDPIYHGNSNVLLPEAVAINTMNRTHKTINGPVKMSTVQIYDEYQTVESFDRDYVLYLNSFEKDGLLYTFFSADKEGSIGFYSIQLAGEAEDTAENGADNKEAEESK